MIYKIINYAMAADELSLPEKPGGTDADLGTVLGFIQKITSIALDIALILGTIMIFVAAFLYVSSFGEESKAETAKKTLIWAAVGTIIAFLAKLFVDNMDKILA
jgi:FtsH-binding integral membrane protein